MHFKWYIKTKRACFGIRLQKLKSYNGVTLDFILYCGKGMFNDDLVALQRPYLDKGHIL